MSKTLKILLTVFVIVLVLGGGATYYFAFYSPKSQTSDTEPTKKTSQNNVTETEEEDNSTTNEYSSITANAPSFTFALRGPVDSTTNSFTSYLYKISDSSTNNKDFTLDYPSVSSSSEASGANDAVQWSADSKVMAYAYGDEGGMDAPEVPNSFSLVAINNGIKQTVISNLEVAQIPKWLLTPNGDAIYYIKASSTDESAEFSLNKYELKTQKTTVEASYINKSFALNGSEIFYLKNNTQENLYIIATKEDNNHAMLYRFIYNLKNKQVAEEILAPGLSSDRAFMGSYSTSDVTVSPDGTMIAYRYKISATKHGVSIYNFADKSSTDIYEPEDKRSINSIKWSPDSKSIAFETTYFGTGTMTSGNLSLVKIDIASKQATVIDTSNSSSSNTGFLRTFNGRQIAKNLLTQKN